MTSETARPVWVATENNPARHDVGRGHGHILEDVQESAAIRSPFFIEE